MANPGVCLRGLQLMAAQLLAVAASLTGRSAARVATSTTTCTGSSPITYSPGITFTPRTVTCAESDLLSTCLSSDPALTSGSATSVATITGSCLSPLTADTDPACAVHWNSGQSSTFHLICNDTIVAGVENVTGAGTVTAGEMLGGSGTFARACTVPDPLLCLTTGVTSRNGNLAATIVAA